MQVLDLADPRGSRRHVERSVPGAAPGVPQRLAVRDGALNPAQERLAAGILRRKIEIVVRRQAPEPDVVAPRPPPGAQKLVLPFAHVGLDVVLQRVELAFVGPRREPEPVGRVRRRPRPRVFADVFPELHAGVLREDMDVVPFRELLEDDAVELPHAGKAEQIDRAFPPVAETCLFQRVLVEIRNGQVLPFLRVEHLLQQRLSVGALLLENRLVELPLPRFALFQLPVLSREEVVGLFRPPFFQYPGHAPEESGGAASFVFQEERRHSRREVEQAVFVQPAVRRQVALHVVAQGLVMRLPLFVFGGQIGQDHVHQHVGLELPLGIVLPDENVEQEPLDGGGVQIREGALLPDPAQPEPLFQLRVGEDDHRGVEGIRPLSGELLDQFVGQFFELQREIQVKHRIVSSLHGRIYLRFRDIFSPPGIKNAHTGIFFP